MFSDFAARSGRSSLCLGLQSFWSRADQVLARRLLYARKHWTRPEENQPIGLILCSERNEAVADYALGNLNNRVLAREYRLSLPDESVLVREIWDTRRALQLRDGPNPGSGR